MGAGISLLFAADFPAAAANDEPRQAGWGIDACLSCHVDYAEVPGYIELLRTSAIQWLRERGPGTQVVGDDWKPIDQWDTPRRRVWRDLKAEGFRVVAFAGFLGDRPSAQAGDQLPPDLRDVYNEGRLLGAQTLGEVDAFELVGEPDAHYCRDLPERVAAYQKAMYLGIKDGAREALAEGTTGRAVAMYPTNRHVFSDPRLPIVLSGALAFPPGNWLDLAVENGIYEFTDAVNFHHYGFAEDLAPAIRAHRQFGARWSGRGELPVWITEIGLNNVPPENWDHAASRQAQAQYIVNCARTALAENIAVFMPFILAHRGDPFAMTRGAHHLFPAWEEYRDFTREHPVDTMLRLILPPPNPTRVVLQWMPDNATCIPFKVGGTYWFNPIGPIRGTLWVYNFGDTMANITVRRHGDAPMIINGNTGKDVWTIQVPATGRSGLAIEIPENNTGAYQQSTFRFSARSSREHRSGATPASRLVFRAGTRPSEALAHNILPIQFGRLTGSSEEFSYISEAIAPPMSIANVEEWTGLNGVRAADVFSEEGKIYIRASEQFPGPLHPPMLVRKVDGLPGDLTRGFLRLTVKDADGGSIGTRVDLVDDAGQRFTIIENLGRLRDEPPASTVWLAYSDFHPWVFGKTTPGARFDPAKVREVQLRFYGLSQEPRDLIVALETVEFMNRNQDK